MARKPTVHAASFDNLAQNYGAVLFQDMLGDFIAQINHPMASTIALNRLGANTLIPFCSVPVFHKMKFISNSTHEVINVIHVRPEQEDTRGHVIPSRFDTAVVCGQSQGTAHGNKGMFYT